MECLGPTCGGYVKEAGGKARRHRDRPPAACLGRRETARGDGSTYRDATARKIDILLLEAERLTAAATSREEEVQKRGESRFCLPCRHQERTDLLRLQASACRTSVAAR